MSILTQAIDKSRKQVQQQGEGTSILRLAIDRARQGEPVEPVQAQNVKPFPVSGAAGRGTQNAQKQVSAQPAAIPSVQSPSPAIRSTQAVRQEMDGVDKALKELRDRQSSLNGQARQLTSGAGPRNYQAAAAAGRQANSRAQDLRNQAKALEEEIARLEQDRAGLETQWEQADAREFGQLKQTQEFKTAVEKAMEAPYGHVSAVSRKPSHRDVGHAMTYFQAIAKGDLALAEAAKSSADMALDRMSQDQRDRLAYYVGIGDYDSAADHLNKIAPALNQEQAEDLEQKLSEWGREHPILGAGVNVVSWPMNIPAYFANATQAAKNAFTGKNEKDPHGSAYGMTKIGTGTSQGVSEAARGAATQAFGSEKAGDAAAFLAGTGLSIGQNAAQIAALGPYSLAGMAMSAAGSETAEALDREATPGQAFALGTASGTIEALTEKLPLDNLFRLAKEGGGKGVKAAALDILKQMGTEATEEAISEIAGNIADAAVMGDQSELKAYIRELQAAGMSKEDAERAAAWQFYGVNTGLAALGGAISGGVMGGGAMALGRTGGQTAQGPADTAIDRAYAAMGEQGMFSQEAQQAAKTAAESLERTRKGPWDGIYLPRGGEGTVALPTVEDAVQTTQEGARGRAPSESAGGDLSQQLAFVEDTMRKAYEAGNLDEQAYREAVDAARKRYVKMTAPQTGTKQGQDDAQTARGALISSEAQDAPRGPLSAADRPDHAASPLIQEIGAQAQALREDYAQGRIGDETFDQGMDSLQAEAELMGMEASEAQKLLDGGLSYMAEGRMNDGTGTAAGEQLSGGDGGRVPGAGAGGEAASLGAGGPQGPADTGGAAGYRADLGQPVRTEAVSSRELGLVGGTDAKTVRVLSEESWNGELRSIARQVRRETGLSVRFTLGPMEMTRSDGQIRQVRGVYNENGIFVQADNGSATAKQIAAHEIFHSYAQADPGLVQAAEEAITERYGREEMRDILAVYAKNLRGIADVSELDTMDAQALADIKNELLADAFAGINAFGAQAGKYQDTVYETLEDRGMARPRGRENAQAIDQRTGPPSEQFSFEGRTEDGIEVYKTSEEVRRLPYKQRVAAFLDIMRGEYRGRTAKFTAGDGQVYYARFNRKDLNKNIYGDKRSSSQGLTAKVNVGADGGIFELVENAQYSGSKPESGKSSKAHSGVSGWDYFVKTVQIDGKLFDLLANVRKKPGGEYVYSIQLNESKKEAPAPSLASSHLMNGDAQDRMLTDASGGSVAQDRSSVKPWDGTLPRGTDGEITLPGGQERYSAQEEVPDGLTLPTLAGLQTRRAEQGSEIAAPTTPQEAAELYQRKRDAQRVYQRAAVRNRLTDHDQIQVGRLLRGELELEHLDPSKDNVKGITEVLEAKREYEELARTIRQWNGKRKAQLRAEADGFLETANQWKDKKAGILYSRETMERNIRDIVPGRDLADRINKRYFQPVHQAAAEANKTKNQYRDRVRALKLSRKKAAGNAVSEAHAVQLLGEAEDNIRWIQEGQGRRTERDGKTLQEWQAVIGELWENSPNLDQDKIRGAVQEFRTIYDELFQQMNEARVRNGYEPVSYRQGYFPHFQADSEGLMAQFGRALGIDTAVTNLPTTINGLTHTFKPGIQWFGNALERKGFDTSYDAVQGFDRYIEGAADVIHQTDNIQALRALAAQARYRTGDEGLRQQVDRVRANENLTDQEKQALIDEIHKEGRFALSNFVVELDEYTNLLANKKSRKDRDMEQALGRRMYNIVKGLESRVAANMVAINPASWLTNFVPLTQGWGTVKTRFMLEGMWDTLKAVKADDGMVGMSSFLTNRRGSDPIVRSWAQGASAWMSRPMEFIDCLTADSLVRARFKQNQAAGLSEAASIEEADAWAAGLMADRSKGATPTLFNRSNPLTKVFTQFQLEVNNQLSYLFKDLPSDLKKKGLAALAAGLMKFLVGAYLYNEFYKALVGRRCALDPIGILNDSVGDFTGYQVPNLVGMAVDAAQGNEVSFEAEKKKPFEAVRGLGKNVAEELPFIGGVLGGGRFPVSSAMPDWESLGNAILRTEWDDKKRAATAVKAMSGPATYLALPFGGGQVKKIYQGLKAVHEGGSWTVDNKGQDILQYPVFNETAQDKLLTLPTALTFGKSSLPTAREWAERGFKSMSAKQTACYQGMTKLGVPQRDAFDLLQAIGGVETPTGEDVPGTDKAAYQKRKLLQEAGISDQGKGVVYYGLLASDKERTLMDSLNEGGADMGEAAKVLMELKDAGAELKGKELSAAKKGAIAGSSLSEEEKNQLFCFMLGEDSKGAALAEELKKAGLSKGSSAAVANAVNALTPEKGKDTVSDAQKWRAVVDTARGAADQRAALLTVMSGSARMRYKIGTRYGIQPEAWVQVKEALPQFDANKNGSYSSGEIEKAIDALAGDGHLLAPWDKDPIRLSREEKAVLWQLFTGSTSGSGNPYSTRVGKQVAKELERAREGAKK